MIEAATSYRKNGFNDDDSAQLAQISAMFSNVADEQISAGDAADFIISQLIAFNQVGENTAENAQHIIDSINEVANSFSVSSGDLSKGLSVVASSSAAMGNSMEQTIGLMTAITEQTRNASKASRGLNTIMARLASVLDESSSNGKAIKQIYADLGLTMEDSNGQLLSGYELLEKLAKEWNDLDGNTQKYIATTVAGTTQLNNFLALMNNFEHATDATNTAIESQGSALKENERYMESLNAKVAELKNTFQDFANNVIDNELVGAVLDAANAFMQFANTDFGQMATQIMLLSSLGWGATSLVQASHIIPAVTSQFKTFFKLATTGAEATAAGMTAAGTATTAFGAAASGALPVILGITAVAVIGKKIYDIWKEANPTLEEASTKLADVNEQLDTNKKRIYEINKLSWTELTPEILSEKAALEKENDELERQIELLEQRKVKAAKKEARTGGVVGTGTTRYTAVYGEDYITKSSGKGFDTYDELVEYLDNYIPNASEKTREELEALGVQFIDVEDKISMNAEEYNQHLLTSMQDYITQLNTQHSLNAEQIQDFENLKNKVGERVTGLKALQSENETITDQERNLINVYDELLAAYNSAVEVTDMQSHSIAVTSDAVDGLLKKYPNLKTAITDVNGALYLDVNALSSVESETWDTQKAMLDLIAQLTVFNNADLDVSQKLTALQQLAASAGMTSAILSSFTTGGINENYARFRNAGLSEEEAMNKLWKSWFRGYNPAATKTNVTPADTGTTGSQTKEKTAVEKANEAWKEQLNLLKDRLELIEKSGGTEEQQIAQMRKIQDAIHKQAEVYRQLGLDEDSEYLRELGILWWDYENDIEDIYDNIEDAAKNAAEETRKAWQEALEQQKSDYETAASYVVDKAQEEIDKLQTLRDETEQYYDDKIQALKDSNDELDKQIEYEELLNKLAQAKQSKLYVFKDGQFQYVQDVEAISSAQADLDAYERERALEQEVTNLEKLKDEALANIDEQIDGWQEYKDEWSNVVQQYTDKQNQLIAEQVLGIDLEQENWEKRLMNAQAFADKYNDIMASLSTASKEGAVSSVGGSSKMSSSDLSALAQAGRDYNAATSQADKDAAHARAEAIRAKYGYSGGVDGSQYIKKYASGTTYAQGGISVVGERGPELRVLGNGDGILPADITRNLWSWGKINPASMVSGGLSNIFNIANLSLPNARDAESLVSGLKQMAYQRAYKRA